MSYKPDFKSNQQQLERDNERLKAKVDELTVLATRLQHSLDEARHQVQVVEAERDEINELFHQAYRSREVADEANAALMKRIAKADKIILSLPRECEG